MPNGSSNGIAAAVAILAFAVACSSDSPLAPDQRTPPQEQPEKPVTEKPAALTGELAFLRGDTVYVSNFDGSGLVHLVTVADLGDGAHAIALSRDASQIAFVSGST